MLADWRAWFLQSFITESATAPARAAFTHDATLLAYSMALGVLGTYASLELCARAKDRRILAAWPWLFASGLLLACAVWATHFAGMIALETPLKRGFAWTPTITSAAFALVCGAFAFTLGGVRPGPIRTLAVGAVLAAGAIVMHYLGMRGLLIDADIAYRADIAAATAAGALISAAAGYTLAHRLRRHSHRIVAAFAMGAVIAVLHYADMSAVIMTARPLFAPELTQPPAATLTLALSAILGGLVLASLAAVLIDLRRAPAGGAQLSPASEDDVIVVPSPGEGFSESDGIVIAPSASARD